MPAPLTTVLLVLAVTISFTEETILWGLPFFILAVINEVARMVMLATTATVTEDDDE